MMIMGDVGRQEVMNPLLRKVGLKLLPGIIAQPSDVNPGDLVLAKAIPDSRRQYRRLL